MRIYILPVVASTIGGGPGTGLVATVVGGIVGTLLFDGGAAPLGAVTVVRFLIFTAEGCAITWLASRFIAAERQVIAAKRIAERANEAKDVFLATLSHELRTPLTVILGFARMLRTTDKGQSSMRMAEVIERNGVMLLRLVEDLLDVQRIQRGELSYDPSVFQLRPLLDTVVQSLDPSIQAKRLRCETVVPDLEVEGDAARLQQVFWNLLSNAIKFSHDGGYVAVRAEQNGASLELRVENSSTITQGFLPYVFDPFRQADMSTTRRHGGLGLGLWIVKNIVEQHGGTIEVRSDGGVTAFLIRLPQARVRAQELHSQLPLLTDWRAGEPAPASEQTSA